MEILDRIDSTSAELKRRLASGPLPHGFTLVAKEQTAGRGRLDREWRCTPGAGLMCSVWVRLDQPFAQAVGFSLVPPVAILDVIRPLLADAGAVVGCKWPNDIRIQTPQGKRKLCGILTECCTISAANVEGMIVGVGLNIKEAPPVGEPPAIALKHILPVPPDAAKLAELVKHALLDRTHEWLAKGREPLFAHWLSGCDHLNAPVRVTLRGVKTSGLTRGLGPMGQLLLEIDGQIQEVWAEDIFA